MGQKTTRRPFKIGGTKAITLPKAWLDFHGDRVETVTLLGDAILIIAPAGLEDKAQHIMEQLEGINEDSHNSD